MPVSARARVSFKGLPSESGDGRIEKGEVFDVADQERYNFLVSIGMVQDPSIPWNGGFDVSPLPNPLEDFIARNLANAAKAKADNVETQLNEVVLEGSIDPETAQARTDVENVVYPTIKARMDAEQNKVNILKKNQISVSEYENLKVAIASGYDWTPAVQKAVNDADEGAVILFPFGGTYHLNNVNHSGKTLHFFGYGAKIIQIANSPAFNFKGGYGAISGISSITDASYDFSGQSQSHPVTKITTSTTLTLKIGDVIKIVSDDEIDGAKTTATTAKRRRGEYAIVGAVSGNDIYLTTLLRETYATNPRIAKLNDVTYSFRGFTFDTLLSGDASGWNASIVTVKAAKDFVFYDIECLKGYSSFLTLVGLYGYFIDRLRVKNLTNDPANARYGYGINDISCENGIIGAYLCINVRHGYTTNTNAVEAGVTDLESFGRTANTMVTGFSHGASNTGFDTHDEAYNIRFVDCYANGSYRGKDATGSGFSARGRKISFVNCVAESCRYGFNVFEQYPNSTYAITLENCKSYNTGNYAIYANTTGAGVDVKGLKVVGGYFEIIRGSRVVELLNVKGEFEACKLAIKVGNSFSRIFSLDNSDIKMKNVKIDGTSFTSTNLILFRLNNNSILVADDIETDFGSGASPRILEGDGTANSARITRFKGDVNPSIASNISNYFFSSKDATIPNMTVYQDVTADNQIPNIANNANDVIYLRLRSTTGNWIMGAIPDGYKRGQLLVIRNSGSSANTITIRTGSAYNAILYGAASRVLSNEQAMTLIWDGTDWMATGA